jgi:hypothetical protein
VEDCKKNRGTKQDLSKHQPHVFVFVVSQTNAVRQANIDIGAQQIGHGSTSRITQLRFLLQQAATLIWILWVELTVNLRRRVTEGRQRKTFGNAVGGSSATAAAAATAAAVFPRSLGFILG